ncbi:hypothetical protein BDN72DRAFT_747445, partial [Pluteus cervinus]
KKIFCISILLHSSNQKCNYLQTLIGLYLHATNTPESVRELLSRLGVSISTDAIRKTITKLSKDTSALMRTLGQCL